MRRPSPSRSGRSHHRIRKRIQNRTVTARSAKLTRRSKWSITKGRSASSGVAITRKGQSARQGTGGPVGIRRRPLSIPHRAGLVGRTALHRPGSCLQSALPADHDGGHRRERLPPASSVLHSKRPNPAQAFTRHARCRRMRALGQKTASGSAAGVRARNQTHPYQPAK